MRIPIIGGRLPSRRFWRKLGRSVLASVIAGGGMALMLAINVIPAIDKWFGTNLQSKAGPEYAWIVLLATFSIATVAQLASSDETEAPEIEGMLGAGAILGVTVVGFAEMDAQRQRRVIDELIEVVESVGTINERSTTTAGAIWLKTVGEGFAVYLEGTIGCTERDPYVRALALGLLLTDATGGPKSTPSLGLVIHRGDGVVYRRIGSSVEWQGHRWTDTVRLMALTTEGHILISNTAYTKFDHDFFGQIRGKTNALAAKFRDAGTPETRRAARLIEAASDFALKREVICSADHLYTVHNLMITTHNGAGAQETLFGRVGMPPSSIMVEQRHPVGDRSNAFIEHLVASDEVCIVGMTHQDLTRYLAEALEARTAAGTPFWDSLDIVFPNRSVLGQMLQEDKSAEQRAEAWSRGRLDVVRFLEGRNQPDKWRCLESTRTFAFTGNRFKYPDGHKNESVIRICPSLSGDQRQAFYLTYPHGTTFHELASDTFDSILVGSLSISEWDIHGLKTDAGFFYRGIALRPSVESIGACVPVVLVVLHGSRGGHKVFLQKRTMFNSSDGHDTYSNISGRIAIEDMFEPESSEFGRSVIKSAWSEHADVHDEARLATAVTLRARDQLGWDDTTEVPDAAWRRGAAREVEEELGLSVCPDRLVYHQEHYMKLGGNDRADRYFRIYSLKLDDHEFDLVAQKRPFAALEPMTISQVSDLEAADRLNRLLARKFRDIFEPLYATLGVDG